MIDTAEFLHKRFNPRSDQIPPVRIKRFKRGDLAALFAELEFTTGAEIGVAEGFYSYELCRVNPHLEQHYCVDLWDTYYRDETKLKNREMQDDAYKQAVQNLAAYPVKFIRESSATAHWQIADGTLDYIYIDGDHSFDYVMTDLIWWSRKVRSGGVVSGHDAYRFRGAGVVDAVSAYTTAHQIREWFLCDERESSFFWVKP